MRLHRQEVKNMDSEKVIKRDGEYVLHMARHGLVQSLYLFPLLKKEVSAHETYL